MTVDRETIARVARVARLQLSPEEESRLQADADAILAYFSSIQALAGEEAPLAASGELREDAVEPFSRPDEIRRGFPRQKEGVALVPRGLR